MRGLFKFVIVVFAVMLLYYARHYWDGLQVQKESAGFAEQAVETITSAWQEADFKKVQDPIQNFFLVNGAQKADLAQSLPIYGRLGKRVGDAACAMENFTAYKSRSDAENYVAANYLCAVTFERAPATVRISVRRMTLHGAWKMSYLDVQSPYLQPLKK